MPANPRCQIRSRLSWRMRPCGSHLLQPQHQWSRRHLAARACEAAPTLYCAPRPAEAAALFARASMHALQQAGLHTTCLGGRTHNAHCASPTRTCGIAAQRQRPVRRHPRPSLPTPRESSKCPRWTSRRAATRRGAWTRRDALRGGRRQRGGGKILKTRTRRAGNTIKPTIKHNQTHYQTDNMGTHA